MYCMQCGTLASTDAKFCDQCGSPVNVASSEKPTETPVVPVVATKPTTRWLYVIAILLAVAYVGIFTLAIMGQAINPQFGPSSMLWTGLFFYLWWKQRDRKGWHGALVGAALGLFIFGAATFISGFMHARG